MLSREIIVPAVISAVIQAFVAYILTAKTVVSTQNAVLLGLLVGTGSFFAFWFFQRRAGVHARRAQDAAERALLDTVLALGAKSSVAALKNSEFEPERCVALVKKHLFFVGILGSKWVIDPRVRSTFSAFLQRMDASGGSVRFFLLDPQSDAYKRLHTLRGGALSADSVPLFAQLVATHPSLDVRLFDHVPSFRLIFIDQKMLALSVYSIEEAGYLRSQFGWDSPHIVFEENMHWSVYQSFWRLYDHLWRASPSLRN